MSDVSNIVQTDPQGNVRLENDSSSKRNKNFEDDPKDEEYEEPVIAKRKRGRPPKKTASAKVESESDSDKYEYNSDDSEDIEDYDIFDDDDDDGKKKRGKKRKYEEEEEEGSTGFEDLDSGDEKEQALLQEQTLKYGGF